MCQCLNKSRFGKGNFAEVVFVNILFYCKQNEVACYIDDGLVWFLANKLKRVAKVEEFSSLNCT